MPGLRIHHPTLRSSVALVPVPAKTERGSDKTVQVTIDADGYCIVSEGVWAELQIAVANGDFHQFSIVNEVMDPPGIVLGGSPTDYGRSTYLVEKEALREVAPAGVNQATVTDHHVPNNITGA